MAAAVSGLSPVIMTVWMPIWRISANRSRMPPFTMSFSSITPRIVGPSATTSGVRPARRLLDRRSLKSRRAACRPARPTQARDRIGRALADLAAVDVDPDIRVVRREGDELVRSAELALADVETLLGQHDDGAALGGLVGQRGELSGVGHLLFGVPVRRDRRPTPCRLPSVIVPVLSSSNVCTSPAASTARPLMASTLRCTRRSMPAMPMADSRRADRGRDQAHQQRHQDRRPTPSPPE